MSFSIRENEQLIKRVRRHFIFVLPAMVATIMLIALVLWVKILTSFDFWGYFLWVVLFVFVLGLLISAYKVYIWKRNVLILTDQRIVEVQQKGLFSSTIMELLYRDVLEISYIKKGIRASIYGFGHIKMRTASNNEIIIENIPNPDAIVEIINKIR